ncbi:MAG TPA: divergent PAP2 family protein [Bacillota bacterium]|nr:divergent PAP2 family protein [Bacillota bacterium]
MEIFLNIPLMSAMIAIFTAQFLKIPIHFIATREFQPGLIFGTGSMPSSHSAAVAALTTSIGLIDGIHSTTFAVSFVFTTIVMYDASGVRRHAGEHAAILNVIKRDLQEVFNAAKDWQRKEQYEKQQELEELLGHQPMEVFFGAITGIIVGLIIYQIF